MKQEEVLCSPPAQVEDPSNEVEDPNFKRSRPRGEQPLCWARGLENLSEAGSRGPSARQGQAKAPSVLHKFTCS